MALSGGPATGTPGATTRPDHARRGGPWDIGPLSQLAPPALVDGELRLSVDQVHGRARAVAGALTDRGVRPGSVVAFQLPNWWESVVLFHAAWALGAVALPIHARGGRDSRAALLARTDPAVVLVASDLDPPPGALTVRGDADAFGDLLEAPPAEPVDTDPAELAVLLATSGSTGDPKLVRHTHRALHGKGHTMVAAHGLSHADVTLMPAPLAHVSGLLNGILVPGAAGMTTVLMERWDPAAAASIVRDERVSFMIGPPTFFVDLAAAEGAPGPDSSLRLISCGGASVTPEFVRETGERFGAACKRTYGSTEAPTVTTTHHGDPPERGATTDGRPTTDVELLVTDPVTGDALAPDQEGELRVRGPELCAGYLDPAQTARAFDERGFFRTGDLARIDDDGWLTVVGRLGSTIIRGGENIAPTAVESVCATLPGVRYAVVVGFPDERLGERVGLVVEADQAPSVEQVGAHCRRAGLARFAWPEHVLRLDAVPRLDAGKPDRRRLSAMMTEDVDRGD